jgi:sarcosine oxidase gamma subunit
VERDGWNVVLEYEGEEGAGPRVVDLSHRRKWLAQSAALTTIAPWALTAPERPGEVSWENGFLVSRMGSSQAAVWHLGEGVPGGDPGGVPALTEVTDGWLLLGLAGSQVFSVADKLTTLDLADPKRAAPCLLQGPFSHIPSSVVVLKSDGSEGVFLVACSRGYARDLVRALTHAGKEFGIRPAGESVMGRWLT